MHCFKSHEDVPEFSSDCMRTHPYNIQDELELPKNNEGNISLSTSSPAASRHMSLGTSVAHWLPLRSTAY